MWLLLLQVRREGRGRVEPRLLLRGLAAAELGARLRAGQAHPAGAAPVHLVEERCGLVALSLGGD